MTVQQRNDSCASCHAKVNPVTADFQPGARFFDTSACDARKRDYFPDGRDRREKLHADELAPERVYSKRGNSTASTATTSSGRYRFSGEKANDACLPCHEERGQSRCAHSAARGGDRCEPVRFPATWRHRIRRACAAATIRMRPPASRRDDRIRFTECLQRLPFGQRRGVGRQGGPRLVSPGTIRRRSRARAALIDAARRRDWSKLPQMLSRLDGRGEDEVFFERRCPPARSLHRPAGDTGSGASVQDPSPFGARQRCRCLAARPSRDIVNTLLAAARDDFPNCAYPEPGPPLGRRYQRPRSADQSNGGPRPVAEYEASLRSRPTTTRKTHEPSAFFSRPPGNGTKALAEYSSPEPGPGHCSAIRKRRAGLQPVGAECRGERPLRKAVAIEPENAAARLKPRAACSPRRGGLKRSRAALRRSLTLDAGSATAAYNLAVIGLERPPGRGDRAVPARHRRGAR